MAEDTAQFEFAKQMAAIQREMLEISKKSVSATKDQTSAMQDLRSEMSSLFGDVNTGTGAIGTMFKALTAAFKSAAGGLTTAIGLVKSFASTLRSIPLKILGGMGSMLSFAGGKLKGLVQGVVDLAKSFGSKLWKGVTMVGAALKGLYDGAVTGFAFIGENAKALFEYLQPVVKSVYNIGAAIYSIPTRVLSGMIQLSNAQALAFKGVAEAYENFRGEFGAFNNVVGEALTGAMAGVREGMEGATGGALGMYSVFGDTTEAIKFFQDQFKTLGPLMDTFGPEIQEMGAEFVALTKSMGLSAEANKTLAMRAKAMGTTFKKQLETVASYAQEMKDAFGISAKSVSQDVAGMLADVRNFGNNSIKTLTATATRMRSLGLEAKTAGKIVDKFLNFEEAAKSASMLSQSFGVNLDALKLMQGAAKGGGETLDQLRNAMFAAGRDAAKMSTAELRLLAQTTGLSEEEARLAFAMENRGKSMEEIQKKAKQADPQERMAETMAKMADNIQRIVRVFEHTSFFDSFKTGFMEGVKNTGVFRDALSNLNKSLTHLYHAGREVGKAFVELFPGVKDMLATFRDAFDPKRYKVFADSIVNTFKNLFSGLNIALAMGTDPSEVMKTFFDNLQKSFGIVSYGPFIESFKKGFMKFLGALSMMIAGTIPLVKDKIIDGLKSLSGFLRDALKDSTEDASTPGFASELWYGFFNPILDALVQAVKDPALYAAIWDALSAVGEFAKESIVEALGGPGSYFGDWFNQFATSFGDMFGNIKDLLTSISAGKATEASLQKDLEKIGKNLGKSLWHGMGMTVTILTGAFAKWGVWLLGEGARWASELTGYFFTFVGDVLGEIPKIGGALEWIADGAAALFYGLSNTFEGLTEIWSGFVNSLTGDDWQPLWDSITIGFEKIFTVSIPGFFNPLLQTIRDKLDGFVGTGKIVSFLDDTMNSFTNMQASAEEELKRRAAEAKPPDSAESEIIENAKKTGQKAAESFAVGYEDAMMIAPSVVDSAVSSYAGASIFADTTALNEALGVPQEVEVPVTLNKKGDTLGADGKLDVQTEAIAMNVVFKVTMDAGAVARVVADTGIVVGTEG